MKIKGITVAVALVIFACLLVSSRAAYAATNNNEPPSTELPSSPDLTGKSILLYANYLGDGFEKNNMKSILTSLGATVTETTTTAASTLGSQLTGKDAFVIPELKDGSFYTGSASDIATRDTIIATFTSFAPVLQTFMANGHNVVFAEGDLEAYWGVQCVLNPMGFTTGTEVDEKVSIVTLTIADPTDPLMNGITAPLKTDNGWMSIVTTDPALHTVATTSAGNIVVAEKTIVSGRFIVIGFDYFSYNSKMADILGNAILKPPVSGVPEFEASAVLMVSVMLAAYMLSRKLSISKPKY